MFDFVEWRKYSQNGEDGVLASIFDVIGTTNRYYVEFGCESGHERNTRFLQELGWLGLLMSHDRHDSPFDIKIEHITAENINGLFRKYAIPNAFDLLSIDIDGNDYWVWKAISESYVPRVVVVEYNGLLDAKVSKTIKYDPNFSWNGSSYFGASLKALATLGLEKSYQLVYCESCGVNAFFVHESALPSNYSPLALGHLYYPLHAAYPPDRNSEWQDC